MNTKNNLLLDEYMEEIKKVFPGDETQNYIKKNTAAIVKTSGGNFISFDKPAIKKDFCFGAGWNGLASSDEWDSACNQAREAKSNIKYFMDENLEPINKQIKELKEAQGNIYLISRYRNQERICAMYDEFYFERFTLDFENKKIIETLSKDDIKKIIETLEDVKKAFTKRLETYLKRYGLSKIKTWSYLVD